MINHPDIDPVAFRISAPFADLLGISASWPVHWYGIMWLSAFIAAAVVGKRLSAKPALAGAPQVDELLTAGIIGTMLGGRLGYVLFYDFAAYIEEPLRVLQIWKGGMSFHGGLLGVIAALFWLSKKGGGSFLRAADFAAVLAPFGLGLGRIGNFINGELPGRAAPPDLPWAMLFPGDDIARHPSPLYQAFLEGVVLGALMWFLARQKRRAPGFLSGVFLAGYAFCRILSEFFRAPDAHIGLLIGGFSMGQLLSFPMLALGVYIMFIGKWTPAAADVRARCLALFLETKARAEKAADAAKMPPPQPAAAAEVLHSGKDSETNGENLGEELEEDSEAETEAESESGEDSDLEESAAAGESKPAGAAKAPWWKKIFTGAAAQQKEQTQPRVRTLSRREKRRQKKKKRH